MVSIPRLEKIVAAKTESYSDEDRRALGAEIKGIRGNLMDLANNRDGSGRYIFGGFKSDTAPFDDAGNYVGGDTARRQTVADGTDMQTVPGQRCFQGYILCS